MSVSTHRISLKEDDIMDLRHERCRQQFPSLGALQLNVASIVNMEASCEEVTAKSFENLDIPQEPCPACKLWSDITGEK